MFDIEWEREALAAELRDRESVANFKRGGAENKKKGRDLKRDAETVSEVLFVTVWVKKRKIYLFIFCFAGKKIN